MMKEETGLFPDRFDWTTHCDFCDELNRNIVATGSILPTASPQVDVRICDGCAALAMLNKDRLDLSGDIYERKEVGMEGE